MSHGYPDASTAEIIPMTEAHLAQRLVAKGKKIVEAHGALWVQTAPGFYECLHPLRRVSASQADKPRVLCAGYRAALCEQDTHLSNAQMPVHLLDDVAGYDLQAVPSRKIRQHLRSIPKQRVDIVRVDRPAILLEQGYEVMVSWSSRVSPGDLPTRERYLRSVEQKVEDPYWLVLAGISNTTLLGYITSWAVGSTAYLDQIFVRTEAMSTHLSAALTFEAVQAIRRHGSVREVCPGPHRPEAPGLTDFKMRMGFPVVAVPIYSWLFPPAALYLRRRRPHLYYRLTGRGPSASRSTAESGE
jgi:hypothetical protein